LRRRRDAPLVYEAGEESLDVTGAEVNGGSGITKPDESHNPPGVGTFRLHAVLDAAAGRTDLCEERSGHTGGLEVSTEGVCMLQDTSPLAYATLPTCYQGMKDAWTLSCPSRIFHLMRDIKIVSRILL